MTPQPASPPADLATVKSAERTVRILEALAASPTKLTLGQIQERMGYPRSSLHALIRTLRELKWLEADATGVAFGIGPHALLSGTAYLDRDPALPYAYEAMEDLRAETGYTVHYARRDEGSVLYLASRDTRDHAVPRVGRKLPLHITALGQALLAQLTADEVDRTLPPTLAGFTPATITSRADLDRELEAVRNRGWAYEHEQGTPGVACVAATVDYRIPATDALSCSMPAARATDAEVDRVVTAVARSAARLAATLRRAGVR
jgi:DNA-binding IclR family transcriptional regulator